MICVLYVFIVTLGLGGAAALVDYAQPTHLPRRWLWFGTIVLSVIVPVCSLLNRSPGAIRILGRTIAVLRDPTASAGEFGIARDVHWLLSNGPFRLVIEPAWAIITVLLFAFAAAHAWVAWRALGAGEITGVADDARIIRTDNIGPAATSLGRRAILLPRWVFALPLRDRRYVVQHELEHIRRKDDVLLFAGGALVALFSWILPLWWQWRRFLVAIETDCDQRVIAALGGPLEYGELLLRVSQAMGNQSVVRPALLGRPGALERRLRSLLDHSPRSLSARALAMAVALSVALAVLTMPHPVGHVQHEDHARTTN